MKLTLYPTHNNSSQFTAIYGDTTIYIYAPRGRMWATIANDCTFKTGSLIASFKRSFLPYVYKDAKYIDNPEIECATFLELFN